jgi:hypothetical protein
MLDYAPVSDYRNDFSSGAFVERNNAFELERKVSGVLVLLV